MKTTKRLVAGVAVGLVALTLTGCKESDKGGGAPPTPAKIQEPPKPAQLPAEQKPKDHPAH